VVSNPSRFQTAYRTPFATRAPAKELAHHSLGHLDVKTGGNGLLDREWIVGNPEATFWWTNLEDIPRGLVAGWPPIMVNNSQRLRSRLPGTNPKTDFTSKRK